MVKEALISSNATPPSKSLGGVLLHEKEVNLVLLLTRGDVAPMSEAVLHSDNMITAETEGGKTIE